MEIKTHEVGGEGPAAKAEREAKEKAAAAEQAGAAKAEAKEDTQPAVKRSHH
jgi:hypothetical protein